jgi:hypothetical protein
VDPATGQVLGTLSTSGRTGALEDVALRGVTLPRTGTYRVHVQDENENYSDDPPGRWGGYRFRVAPAP